MEEWRDVPGFKSYQIDISTNEARCRHILKNGTVKILSNRPNKRDGRVLWSLFKDCVQYTRQAARWVALTFPELVENYYFDGAEIDHVDTDRLNNLPSNLRWVDRTRQMNNTLTKEHIKETLKNRTDLSKPVIQYDSEGNYMNRYESAMEAYRITGVRQGHISSCCRGDLKMTGRNGKKFIWRYAE